MSNPDATAPVIALDCDGVLLDYSAAYATAWHSAFGVHPAVKSTKAYWPWDRWDVEHLTGGALEQFRSAKNSEFWSTLPAIPGALQACLTLVNHGYVLVCVTALDDRFAAARARNLDDLGFPIKQVITTGKGGSLVSPKAKALTQINPIAFVDDYAPYLAGVDDGIHKALIIRDPVGSPNTGAMLRHANSQHATLAEFGTWWVEKHHMRHL